MPGVQSLEEQRDQRSLKKLLERIEGLSQRLQQEAEAAQAAAEAQEAASEAEAKGTGKSSQLDELERQVQKFLGNYQLRFVMYMSRCCYMVFEWLINLDLPNFFSTFFKPRWSLHPRLVEENQALEEKLEHERALSVARESTKEAGRAANWRDRRHLEKKLSPAESWPVQEVLSVIASSVWGVERFELGSGHQLQNGECAGRFGFCWASGPSSTQLRSG